MRREMTTDLIAQAVTQRGYEPLWLRTDLFVVEIDGRVLGWNVSRCVITSTVGYQLTMRKDYSRTLLRRAGLTVAAGGSYRPDEHDIALDRARRVGWPVVVKPASAGKGRGVAVARDEHEFAAAWGAAASGPRVIVERRVRGDEARFLTVAGKCVAVAGRIPAHVVGDGRSTVAELVAAKNATRSANPHLRMHRVPLTGDPERIPDAGERVILDHRGGFSTGADSIDLTDTVHPSYTDIAGRAERAFPGLGLAGVDIIAVDWSQPATPDNHIVVEVNSRPGIGAHHYPWEGKPRDVAGAIVDACIGTSSQVATMRTMAPRIGADDDGTIVIGNDSGSVKMSEADAREAARRLLEWLGDEPDGDE